MSNVKPADLVVTGGTVHPLASPEDPSGRQSIVVVDGIIQAVLPPADAEAYIGADTEVHDFGDSVLMPGFVDPHAHVEVASVSQHGVVDVRVPNCRTIPEVLDTLRGHLDHVRDGWLVAQGNLFFDRKLEEGRFPTRAELDTVSTEVAIIIRAGGHLSILNSAALARAGITRDFTPSPDSITGTPTVERDANGEPSGIVMEMDNLIPFPRPGDDELPAALRDGVADMFTPFGVTTIGEISETVAGLATFRDGIVAGDIPIRMHTYLWVPGTTALETIADPAFIAQVSGDRPDLFSVRGVKVWADGGFSAAMAAIGHEYVHAPGSCGSVSLSPDEIDRLYAVTREAGLHLAIHANGDRAQLEVCEALIASRERHGAHPHIRVEHAGNYVPDYAKLTDAWRAAGIVPVPQPIFIRNFGEFVPDYVGDSAWNEQFPFKDLLADGWEISGSSDVWIGSDYHQTNPFMSVSATLDRLTFHRRQLVADQAINRWQALRMHTGGGAHALGKQGEVGVLAPGARADIIALDRDPMLVPVPELESVTVKQIIFNGGVLSGGAQSRSDLAL